jgi:hypothetical protein
MDSSSVGSERTLGHRFYAERIALLRQNKTDELIDLHDHDDAVLITFQQVVCGREALKLHFRKYMDELGRMTVRSLDRFTEKEDTIFFEATVETALGEARVYDGFLLHENNATRHFTGVKQETEQPRHESGTRMASWIPSTLTRIFDATILDVPPELIWETLRDFGGIVWSHPDVRDCLIEDGSSGNRIGAARTIHLADGTPIRERRTAISDKDLSYSYSVVEPPLSLAYHSSTVSWVAVEEGSRTLLTWSAEFTLGQGDPEQMADSIHSLVILPGFGGLAKLALESAL